MGGYRNVNILFRLCYFQICLFNFLAFGIFRFRYVKYFLEINAGCKSTYCVSTENFIVNFVYNNIWNDEINVLFFLIIELIMF